MLYEALFGNAGTDSVTLQMNLYYRYKINANLQYIQLPVFLMPPTLTALIEGNEGEDLSKIIEKQVKGWETWQNTCKPETLGGELIFELIVMSNLTARPMPILQLSELFLSIDNIKL